MTLGQLTAFVRIVEFGSLSKAAASLRIAQPALSRQMRSLEHDLGDTLLVRHAWGVTPTPAGEILLDHARQILRETEAARSAVEALSREPSGAFAFGAPTSFAQVVLPHLARRVRSRFPRLRLQLIDGFSATLHQWALSGRLDLAVLYDDATGPLPSKPLLTERLVMVGPAGAFDGEILTPADLAGRALIVPSRPNRLRLLIDSWAPAAEVMLEVDSLPALLELVRLGEGVTVLAYSSVHHAVAAGQLSVADLSPAARRTLILAYPPHRSASPAQIGVEAELRALIAEAAERLQWTAF